MSSVLSNITVSLLTFFSLVLTLTLVMWNNDEVLGGERISVCNLVKFFVNLKIFKIKRKI